MSEELAEIPLDILVDILHTGLTERALYSHVLLLIGRVLVGVHPWEERRYILARLRLEYFLKLSGTFQELHMYLLKSCVSQNSLFEDGTE